MGDAPEPDEGRNIQTRKVGITQQGHSHFDAADQDIGIRRQSDGPREDPAEMIAAQSGDGRQRGEIEFVGQMGANEGTNISQVAGVRAGKRVTALQSFEPAPSPVSLVYVGQGPLLLKIRAFIDFAAPRLKARLAEIAN